MRKSIFSYANLPTKNSDMSDKGDEHLSLHLYDEPETADILFGAM